jgi:transposase
MGWRKAGSVTAVRLAIIDIQSVTEALIQPLSGKRSSFLGFRAIGRILNCSHVAAYNWIKAYGESIESIRSNASVEVVEMDEMHTYMGSKKTIAGSGWLLIEMADDSSTAKWVPATQKQAESYGRPLKTSP